MKSQQLILQFFILFTFFGIDHSNPIENYTTNIPNPFINMQAEYKNTGNSHTKMIEDSKSNEKTN